MASLGHRLKLVDAIAALRAGTNANASSRQSAEIPADRALNHAFVSQHIHFVTGIAEKSNKHLARVFSELWRRSVGVEGQSGSDGWRS